MRCMVLGGAEPQVGGPHLDAELAVQKDRRRGAAAAEVEHAHAGLQLAGPFVSHSVSQSELAPPLTLAAIQSG